MILLDTDVLIDLLRQFPPAVNWFNSLNENEKIILPGFVFMELIQGCKNKEELEKLQIELALYEVKWPSADCAIKQLMFLFNII